MANPTEAKNSENKPSFDDTSRLRDVVGQNARNADNAADKISKDMDQAAQSAEQMGAATTDAVSELAQRAADRGRENVRQGIHAMSSAQAPLADMGYDNSRRFVEASAGVTKIYQDATESAAEDVKALVGTYSNIGRGMQRYQHALLDEVSRSMQTMAGQWQALFRAKTPVAFAEIHREIYSNSVKSAISGSTKLLHLVEKVTQEAVRPIHERESQKSQGKSL